MIAQQLLNGLVLGAVYALVALGYTMVYGIIRLINFAQGAFYTVGAYIALSVLPLLGAIGIGQAGPQLVLAMLIAMAAVGLLAVITERAAYRPLRHAPLLAPLVSSLAAFVLLENVVQTVWGAEPLTYPTLISTAPWQVGPLVFTPSQVLIVVVSLALMAGLQLFTHRTRLGKAMRAVAVDHEAATLMGINVNRIISWTFFIGGALGAAGGVLVGINYGTITFDMGNMAGLSAFTAAVLGGIGNVPGAMLGGILLGEIESLSAAFLPSQWMQAVTFAVLILVLAIRPVGILGERVANRV